MGSNVSTVNERKAPIVAKAPPHHHAYNRSDAHRWTIEPRVKGVAPAASIAEASSKYKTPSSSVTTTNKDQSNVIEIIRPAIFPDHSANTNRVISFHSRACWREFFQASKHSDKLIVIFFSAKWCGFCKYMDTILNDLAAEYTDVEFDKIDVDELFDISREFRVHAAPTFLFVKRGKEVDKVTGTRHDDIRRKIETHKTSA